MSSASVEHVSAGSGRSQLRCWTVQMELLSGGGRARWCPRPSESLRLRFVQAADLETNGVNPSNQRDETFEFL